MLIGFMIGLTVLVVCTTCAVIATLKEPIEIDWNVLSVHSFVIIGVPTVAGFWLEYFL